jgi:predicted metal-dependent phosphoesterase TrpH
VALADLHIHTIASDGCWTPERVIVEVQSRRIGLFAIADHDSVASVGLAEALAHEAGLAFLRGVEVSTLLDGHLFHVLAYGFDLDDPAWLAFLEENRTKLVQTNETTMRRLIAAGYEIDLGDYAAYEYDRARGGWKGLNFLIDRGFCTDVRDYMRNLMARLPVEWPAFPHPAEAVAVMREVGAVPILAHPGVSLRGAAGPFGSAQDKRSREDHTSVTDEALRPFLDFGIAGLECYSNYHDEATTRFCVDWCTRHNLLITGGSDCHGGFIGRELGVPAVDTADLRLGELEDRIIH